MKHIFLSSAVLCSLAMSPMLYAATITNEQVSNDYFVVDFLNTNDWNIAARNNIDSIRTIVGKSIDHWADLLGDAHLPTVTNRVTVSMEFTAAANAGGSIPLFHTINPKTDAFYTLPNGSTYTTVSYAEAKLKHGQNFTAPGEYDISLTFNQGISFHYGESEVPLGDFVNKDFHTFFLHELTHGMGVASQTFTKGYTPNYIGDGIIEKTAWDAIMGINVEDLQSDGSFDNLSTTYIGEDGIYVIHDHRWVQGTSMSHLSAYPNSELDNKLVMVPQILGTRREFSPEEIEIFKQMGWKIGEDVIPEPGTATLSIFALAGFLLRRRRKA